MVFENSHVPNGCFRGICADADRDGLQWLDDDPVSVQDQYGDRWLTTDFAAGDVLVFGMHTRTAHSTTGRRSVGVDCRRQPLSAGRRAADPRWNGSDFEGHGVAGSSTRGWRWNNADFQDEWKDVDECGRIVLRGEPIVTDADAELLALARGWSIWIIR